MGVEIQLCLNVTHKKPYKITLQFRLVHLILDKNLKTQSLLQHITSKTLQMFSLKTSLKAG
jgi:hypothetical protein